MRTIPSLPTTRCIALLLPLITAIALRAENAVPVVTAEARLERVVEELPLTGTITARQQAALSPRTSGLVSMVYVDAGDQVKTGDKLVSLDATLAGLAVERAQAALGETRARLAESKRLRDEAQSLLASHTIAATEAQNREAEFAIATAATARLEIEARESAELLARHDIIAPFDGVVTQKLTDAGEWVATGTPAIRLVAVEGARVDVQMPQERLAHISTDTPVEILPDAQPGPGTPGRVSARVPVSDPGTRTALVRVEPTDPTVRLLPGKSARVIFRLRSAEPILTVSRDALVRRPDGTVNVWLAVREGDAWKAFARRVDLGRAYSDLIEIRSGIEPGQLIIIRGNETLREGQVVRFETATVTPTP
jgi:RND family efflux transporter MFP subunit